MKNKTLSFLCLITIMFGLLPHGAAAQQKMPPKNGNETVDEILEKNVEAIGGREAFAAIKLIERTTESAVMGRVIKIILIEEIAGKRSYQRQDGGAGIIESGFDGTKAWQKAPFFKGYLDATNPQAKSLMSGGVKLPGAVLYDYQASGKKFERLADEQLGGKNYLVVKSADTDNDGKEIPVKYYFDPSTYLLKQTISGDAVTQTKTYDDYRKVGRVTVAFIATAVNSQYSLISKITGLKFNEPFKSEIFEFQETTSSSTSPAVSKSDAAQKSSRTETPQTEKSGELSETARLDTFETVWKTVNDTFFDQAFNGVNWRAIHDKYLPLAKGDAQSEDFHKLLNRMVQELHLSHFKVVPPTGVRTLSSRASESGNGSIGLSVQYVGNQMLAAAVKKDSPAALAGIRPGFVLRRVNGKTPDELYAEYRKENTGFQLREKLARARSVSGELAGKSDTKVDLEFSDANDKSLKLELTRKAQTVGNQLEFESKKLNGNIGYIKFNLFFGDLLLKFAAALNELRDTKALIIDLRGNPGGAGDLAPALANLLCKSPGSLGSFKYRYETTQYAYAGLGERAYKGKIVILTDEGTGSTSEVFAGGMQSNKRAVVVGSPSAGAVLPSLVALLPTGGVLQYVVASFQTSDGTTLEGRGIVPDIAAETTRRGLLTGRDEIFETSLKFINEK